MSNCCKIKKCGFFDSGEESEFLMNDLSDNRKNSFLRASCGLVFLTG